MVAIPFVDLGAQYRAIQAEIDAAIQEVLASTAFVGGAQVRQFEAEFAEFCQVPYAIGVANGTDAIELALQACGVGPGDEVITVSHTFTATAEAIVNVGATPVFVDIHPQTYTMAVEGLEARITPRTKVIMPVHLYGHPADMDPIVALARRHGLRVIEDAAQAQGARYQGRRAGSLGDIACFSFYPGKNLGAYGDAGAVVTADPDLAQYVRRMHDHGRTEKYVHEHIGRNSRLDGLQAAILRVKLRHLDQWNDQRRDHAALYDELLPRLGISVPIPSNQVEPIYHLYVVRVPDREGLGAHLKAQGIATGIHYPLPLHLQPAYCHLGYREGDLPVTEAIAAEVLSLPMFPELTTDQIETVVGAVAAFVTRESTAGGAL
ncbi:MAG: DegT/DnrJ/EryC1/StrS family aminotransferase [Chloroflexi bacterium]|nr:DegT/DnrJ/EryC1/StrS family aminotransferase [Chloroflexota bacterium]